MRACRRRWRDFTLPALALALSAPLPARAACEEERKLALAAALRPAAEVEALLDAGVRADPTAECLGTHSPLELAAERGRSDVVRVLLAHGALVRRAPLWAGRHDDPELMGLLIDALPEALRAQGMAEGLEGAATRGNVSVIRELLERGADPARERCNALEHAAAGGYVEAVRLLVAAGFDPADRRAFGAALAVGEVESVEAGLARGFDPHALDPFSGGGNALSQLAAATGPARAHRDLEIAALLLERGVDPNAPYRGVLPLTLARERANPELAERLEQAGARAGTTFAWKLDRAGGKLRAAGYALVLLLGGGH
jgi:ankyrin repeat protein